MSTKKAPIDQKSTSYEVFILLLSILSLVNVVLISLRGVDPLVKGVITTMDVFITLIFLADFLYRFFTVPSKSEYFLRGWGWADLLSSVPIQQFKIFRIFRIVKVVRVLRHYGPRRIINELLVNRAGSALFLTIFLVLVVLEFGGSLIVAVEADDPDSNIKTAGDGVWWAFVTITTVGYGDRFPVTESGRLVGKMTMVLGVGLFGVLTGFLANAFIPPEEDEESELLAAADGEKQEHLREFKRLLDEQERVTSSLRARLAQIEGSLEEEQGL